MYYWIHVQIYKSVSTFEKLVPEDNPNLPPSDDMKTATNGVNYQYINALKELLRHVLKYKKVRLLHEFTNSVIFYKYRGHYSPFIIFATIFDNDTKQGF